MEAPEEKWLQLREEINALDYLRRAGIFIREAETDVTAWKWTMIALHGAIYGFAVAAARGTNYDQVLTKKGKLLQFWDVLKLCQDPDHMQMLIHSRPLILSTEEKESLEILTSLLRNEFLHFKPKSWLIEIHGMPKVALDALAVIRFLALETGTYTHLTDVEASEIEQVVRETSNYLRRTELYQELMIGQELHRRGLAG